MRNTRSSREQQLDDLLTLCLLYIEDAENDEAYKPGVVRTLTAKIRAAITREQDKNGVSE